jgi:hypothetical protein
MAAASLGLALISVLVAVTVTDLDRRVIPNRILLAGAVAGVAITVPTDPASLPERLLWAALASGGGAPMNGKTHLRPRVGSRLGGHTSARIDCLPLASLFEEITL